MGARESPLWRSDKTKVGPDGKPVKFPVLPDSTTLPAVQFPTVPYATDDDGGGGDWESFSIQLIYEDDTIEMIPITAIDADDALNKALEIRDPNRKHLKVKTTITHDGLGEVIGQLITGIEQGYTIGSRVVGRAGRAGARVVSDIGHVGAEIGAGIGIGAGRTVASFRRIKSEYQIGRLERLLNDAASENPTRRAVARREIQTIYPQIYRHIGFRRV